MFLTTSQIEHLDHILKKGKLHLYGVTDIQVLEFCFGKPLLYFSCCISNYSSHHLDIDVEFGRLQARDMLQHLWTGPISNASVEVVQGSRSVEVRAANVTKVMS